MFESLSPFLDDLIGCSASLALIVAYHFYLRARLRANPNYTIQAVNNSARFAWVHHVMGNHAKDVMAVQTLRNSTMAAIFMASTSILLIIGVLNLSQQGQNLSTMLQTINHEPLTPQRLWAIKLLPLVVDFFWAFFAFTLAIRMYNHVGYLIDSTAGGHKAPTPAYVATLLNRGGWYYSIGMRSYYLSVPLVFWLFGPWYMLAASIGLITVLYHVDRSPKLQCMEQAMRGETPSAAAPIEFPKQKGPRAAG